MLKKYHEHKKKQKTFDDLKITCINELLLKMFHIKKLIRIKIDTLNLIIKTCLNQKNKKFWLFIIYYLKKLSLIEQNYDVYNKKLLIIITLLKNWKVYLEKIS